MKAAIRLITFMFVMSSAQVVFSYDTDRAKTNQAHELAECVVFYSYGAEAAKRSGSLEAANALTRPPSSEMHRSVSS